MRRRSCARRSIAGEFAPWLLDGVTGSGKTEVYFEAIAEAIRRGRQALVLLPEIALTEPFLKRFAARFGCEPVAWHSGLAQSQRRRAWRAIASGEARVTVGARSALFLPYRDLGLIVVDEAHEASFKQEDGVQYHARDVAVMRAKLEEIPGHPRLGHPGHRDAAHGRDRHVQGDEAAGPLWRRATARHGRTGPAAGAA